MKDIIGYVVVYWIAINTLTCVLGIVTASMDTGWAKRSCSNLTRVEYVFPGYHLGCWLNERTDK